MGLAEADRWSDSVLRVSLALSSTPKIDMRNPGVRYSTILAMLVAPLAACVIAGGVAWAVSGFGWRVAIAVFWIAAVFAVPTTVLIGPFVYALLQRRNWRRWFHYLLAGAATAICVTAILALYAAATGELQAPAFLSISAVSVGVLTGLIGWAIRRPDRDRVSDHPHA